MKTESLIRLTAAVLIAISVSAPAAADIVATTPNQRPTNLSKPAEPIKPNAAPTAVEPRRRASHFPVSFRTRGKGIAEACRVRFVDEHGDLGGEGRRLVQLMSADPYRKRFLNGRSLRAFCPKFSPLWSEELQLRAWTWFWMVLANEESGCEPRTYHPTHTKSGRRINPKPGYGLYAAELYGEHRNWRGKMCRGDISQSETQLRCAVHTMAATQLARGRGAHWVGSYWGPVRRASRQIKPNMKGFKACF